MSFWPRGASISAAAEGESWDSQQLDSEVEKRTSFLKGMGIGPDTRVLICHGNSPGFFADLFAVWSLGGCAVCLDPALTSSELSNVANFLSPSLLLVDDGFPDGAGLSLPIVSTRKDSNQFSVSGGTRFDGNLDSPALILLTSGTTGTPKGVVLSFRALLARLALNRVHIGDDVLRNTLCVLPTHFGHGLIGNCLTPLYAGKHLILAPLSDAKRAKEVGTTIDSYKVTFMCSVPAMWKIVLKIGDQPTGGSLRQVSVGSAPLSKGLWQDIIDWTGTNNVVNMYGITEAANWVAGATGAALAPEDGLIGVMWGGAAAVVDDEGNMRNDGEGELVLQTPALMAGYYGRPDLTGEVLRGGWFRTGDVGSIDAAGVMRLTGRIKTEINRAGIKIHPEEVDSLLERHPEVIEACVFGIPDEISGEVVGAAVQLTSHSKLEPVALRTWALELVRRESVPERWFFLNEIPKNDRGKVNRQKVMDHCMKVTRRS